MLYLALVGRARSELDAGQNAPAIADASRVPNGFVYNATYDATTDYRTNHVYTESNADKQYRSPRRMKLSAIRELR